MILQIHEVNIFDCKIVLSKKCFQELQSQFGIENKADGWTIAKFKYYKKSRFDTKEESILSPFQSIESQHSMLIKSSNLSALVKVTPKADH